MSETDDFAAALNSHPDGWVKATGLHFTQANGDQVVAELEVQAQHLQAFGIVHGGVYAGIIETVASVGSSLHAMTGGRAAVGLENHTSFIHAVRGGRLIATGLPITRGRRTQVWEVTIRDEQQRIAATGRVRLLCVEQGEPLAGEKLGFTERSRVG